MVAIGRLAATAITAVAIAADVTVLIEAVIDQIPETTAAPAATYTRGIATRRVDRHLGAAANR